MRVTVVGGSEYKGVFKVLVKRDHYEDEYKWIARGCIHDLRWDKLCDSEKEAAIAYDKKKIEIGKSPVNVLKKKI